MGEGLLMAGDNMFKILSPNLHSCASLRQIFLGAKNSTPKWRFFAILGLEKGLFEGGKCATGVIHLDRWITT